MMKVKDLIILLQNELPDAEVIVQKDPEGNEFSPLNSLWRGKYNPITTWYGEVGLAKFTELDKQDGYTDEDVMQVGVLAVMLVPVN